MTLTARRRFHSLLIALLLIIAVTSGAVQPAVAYANEGACPAQAAALDAVQEKIAQHNASAGGRTSAPPEIADPYNQRATRLEGEQGAAFGKLEACQRATAKAHAGGPPERPLSPKAITDIANATAATRPLWRTPTPPAKTRDGKVQIPQGHPLHALWSVVRAMRTPMRRFPNVTLQGDARPEIGNVHPSGYTVGTNKDGDPAVSPDHIVPKVEIMYLPRFLELTPENMWLVLNAATNLQWLPSYVNRILKNSRSSEDMLRVDSEWQREQEQLQKRKREELIDLIAELADSQLP